MSRRAIVVTSQPHNPLPDVGGMSSLDWAPFDEAKSDGGLAALFARVAMIVADSQYDHDVEVMQFVVELPERFDADTDPDIITDWIDSETDCWVSETAQSVLIVRAS